MEENVKELREHAARCRRLARGIGDLRTRAVLRTLAAEFDEQADEEDRRLTAILKQNGV